MWIDEGFRAAQNHTGEHIVSGIVHNKFGFNNVGFHALDVVTADFDGELTFEQMLEVEREANEAIAKDIPVKIWYPSREEIPNLTFRAKLELDQMPVLRLVEIGDLDCCACSARHVESTGQVGIIKILTVSRHRGGTRVTIISGLDALDRFNQYQTSVTGLSNLLSSPREDVLPAAEKLMAEKDALKQEKASLEERLVDSLPVEEPCVFVDLGDAAQRKYCNILMEHHPVAAVFCGERYIIGSKTLDLRARAREINEAIFGRGGGRPEMISGTAKADKDRILSWFGKVYK